MTDTGRILFIEDEPSIIATARKRLELAGFEVVVAEDGQDGLAKAHTVQPDLIVLDVRLPKLDGLEVCRQLKGDPRYRHIPIVIWTVQSNQKERILADQYGADAYILKPSDSKVLIQRIQALLAESSQERKG